MRYILQIFTGGWKKPNYTVDAVLERLKAVTDMLPVDKVIIGWNPDRELCKRVGEFLKDKGISMLSWLPVFAEANDLMEADEALDIRGKKIAPPEAMGEESFSFCCPSSERNRGNIIKIFEENFSDCGFDGVFLDRIRTQSFVAGVWGVLSCGCPRCMEEYAKRGLNLKETAALYEEKQDHFFDVQSYDPHTGFVFEEPLANEFFTLKGELVSEAVTKLCRAFKERGLITGLDLFSPLMSTFVGQPFKAISESCDFIKPMLYRKTQAPAGIGYEYELFKKAAPKALGCPDIRTDEDFLRKEALAFSELDCGKYPGIEVNYREDIARTDPAYIKSSLKILKDAGMDGATLSWDIMLAPDEHIKAAAEVV